MIPKKVATSSQFDMYNQGKLFRSSANVSYGSFDPHSRVKTRSTMRISQVSSIPTISRSDKQRFGIVIERLFHSKVMTVQRQVLNLLIFRYHLTKSVLIMGSESSKSPSAVHFLEWYNYYIYSFESDRKPKPSHTEIDSMSSL